MIIKCDDVICAFFNAILHEDISHDVKNSTDLGFPPYASIF